MRYVNIKYIRPSAHGCVCGIARPDSIPGPVTPVPGSLNMPTAIYRVVGVPEHVRDEEVAELFSLTAVSTTRRFKVRFEELGDEQVIFDS